jgi:D-mannonate dehydratase
MQSALERLAWLTRLRDLVPSKAHGVTLCQDCLGRRGINLVEAAHLLGGRGRIHHVHYRTPRRPLHSGDVWRDEITVDALFGLRECRDVGYQGALCPCRESDPDAFLPVDLVDRARALGYIRALIRVASRL